ncbi:hypothetical protein ASPSYDRAFT_92143 [Aspergillus sydowii CBS 593.65]|uniref:Heterokaryon incompatibility domain-containing protein n=1 Tax=Aspergillus sydowii CBS 593.65 TaxID=1036612 RepID=A0A1L9T920_9EURO|nr:uncharacterized protein ASPSYDRAFT_92143 [Aspergillus sydowii CBS 593.65]OJJ55940.1 hypothetical protein ASPSYDRAFT_92143 [Aspergillus sydowii CBS 593.65]
MPGFRALTKDHVSAILDQSSFYPADKYALLPIEMRFISFAETGSVGKIHWNTSEETTIALEKWCRDAFELIKPGDGVVNSHFNSLDAHLAALMLCNFQTYKQEMDKSEIVDRACALLARLPSHPPELPFAYEGPWPDEYFTSGEETPLQADQVDMSKVQYKWAKLKVLSTPSTNSIRLALFLVMDRSVPLSFTGQYSDTIVSLLDTTTRLLDESPGEADAQAWFVLQAFLWAAWQHTVMIQLWYDGSKQMDGYRFDRHNDMIAKQIPAVMPGREVIERSRPNYMCKWAFELLRSDLSCVPQDFRAFLDIYERRFKDRSPRCNIVATSTGPKRICDGKAPGNCQRFESEGVQIQGAHDFSCPGPDPNSSCHLLTWDEQSYLSITDGRARAISLEDTDDEHIRYTPVTKDTMAVSHVWSHGQGGRPETGFNSCLHRRYSALARTLNCTSYWMDSPCVPTDRTLRAECIGQINGIFESSKVTLLADRDIMDIDIHPRTLEAEESILATLLVCDWNVRAWTLLEGMRGRAKLHILCKDNHVISLVDVLNSVLSKSCLSLVSPCLAALHYSPTQVSFDDASEPVSIEQATCLLNHRHATKDRDVPMIWALVAGSETVIKAADEFWVSKIGEPLATGFLVSGSPRINKTRGLGWAPARPNLLPPAATDDAKQYPAYDGQNSVPGRITKEGFRAEWLGAVLRRRGMGLGLVPAWMFSVENPAQEGGEFREYFRVYNKGGSDKMDMKTRRKIGSVVAPLFKTFRWVALLMPALRDRGTNGATAPPRPFAYQGESEGPVVVVVASNDQEAWEWQFIYEWERECQLPEFGLAEFLLV